VLKEILLFLKSGIDPNVKKLVDTIKEYGISDLEARVMSSIMLGWVSAYLNGATCPECLSLITDDAREALKEMVDGRVICPNCGKEVYPIMVTPYRLRLCIMNNASIFDTVPNKIKSTIPQNVLDRVRGNWSKIETILRKIQPNDLYSPILSWMRKERPDLYYTILFYNDENNYIGMAVSYMCTTIYEINFYSSLDKTNPLKIGMKNKARECLKFLINWYKRAFNEEDDVKAKKVLFGREKPRLRDVRDMLIEVLDNVAQHELEELSKIEIGSEDAEKIVSRLAISTEGIKWFAGEIEEIYIKGIEFLKELI